MSGLTTVEAHTISLVPLLLLLAHLWLGVGLWRVSLFTSGRLTVIRSRSIVSRAVVLPPIAPGGFLPSSRPFISIRHCSGTPDCVGRSVTTPRTCPSSSSGQVWVQLPGFRDTPTERHRSLTPRNGKLYRYQHQPSRHHPNRLNAPSSISFSANLLYARYVRRLRTQ